jgi:hypothetical protein
MATSYNPAISGAIASLNFAIDTECLTCSGDGQGFGAVIQQNGHTYINFLGDTFGPTSWNTSTTNGLVAADFSLIDLSQVSYVDSAIHPDFSHSGGLILFGFLTANNSPGGSGGFTKSAGYDNFLVDINTAATQLPAALPLFATGLGALGLLGWRRKRKAAAALAA